jgi:hypothetical protein
MAAGILSTERLLVILVAVLGLSLVYPQAAYPMFGAGLGAVIAGVAILAVIRWQQVAWKGMSASLAIAIVLGAAWSAWWLASWMFISPVPTLGSFATATTLQSMCAFVAFAALVVLLPEDWNIRHLLSGWLVLICGLVAIHAIYQVIGPEWLPYTFASRAAMIEAHPEALAAETREGILHALREGRASGLFGSPNILAGFMAMGLPIAIAMAFGRRVRWMQMAFAGAAIVMVIAILMSGSRGGLLGGLVGVMAVFALLSPRLVRRGATTAMLLIMLLGAASTPGFLERWTGVSTVQQRFLYWDSAVAIWSQSPILGTGPGGFELYYPIHRDVRANETRYAHSWFFQWGSEVGIGGLALFLGWSCVIIATGIGRWRREGAADSLNAGLLAAFIVLLIHGLVEFTLSICELALHLALIGALIVSGPRAATAKRALCLGGVFGAGASLLLFVVAWWPCQYAPSRAQSLRELVGLESPEEDLRQLSRALQWQPKDASIWEARAFARSSLGVPGARDDLQRALELNPYSSRLHESMSRMLWAAGEKERAIELQREAIRLHPADPGRRLIMADYLIQTGDREGARDLIASTDGMLWTRREALGYREALLLKLDGKEE